MKVIEPVEVKVGVELSTNDVVDIYENMEPGISTNTEEANETAHITEITTICSTKLQIRLSNKMVLEIR